jgi:hypothetical protein
VIWPGTKPVFLRGCHKRSSGNDVIDTAWFHSGSPTNIVLIDRVHPVHMRQSVIEPSRIIADPLRLT